MITSASRATYIKEGNRRHVFPQVLRTLLYVKMSSHMCECSFEECLIYTSLAIRWWKSFRLEVFNIRFYFNDMMNQILMIKQPWKQTIDWKIPKNIFWYKLYLASKEIEILIIYLTVNKVSLRCFAEWILFH